MSSINIMGADDAWDDTELIKSYEKAVKNWKKNRKEAGGDNEVTPGPGPWTEVPSSSTEAKEKAQGAAAVNALSPPKMMEVGSWIIGSPCRAIYSEDGIEYEAKIVGIEGLRCTVRFVGYGNEEQVNITDLKTTHGKKSRDKQRRSAHYQNEGVFYSNMDEMDDCFSSVSLTSSMYNNYTDSVYRDKDLEEGPTFSCGTSSSKVTKASISTPQSYFPSVSIREPVKSNDSVTTSLKGEVPAESLDDGVLPSGVEAEVDSSSEVSSVAVDGDEAGQDFINTDWENFTNTMPQFRFPVPPMPLSFSNPAGACDFGRGKLPSLLMAWYMAGYQAGYYDAKQELASTSTMLGNQGQTSSGGGQNGQSRTPKATKRVN